MPVDKDRVVSASLWVIAGISAGLAALRFGLEGPGSTAGWVLASVVVVIALCARLTRTSPGVAAWAAPTTGLAAATTMAATDGGLMSETMIWLPMFPLAGVYFLGRRGALALGGAALLVVGALGLGHGLGYTFSRDVTFGGSALLHGVSTAGAVAFAGFLGWYHTKAADQAVAAKDRFVSSVSHELRTPLTSIQGSIGLLRADQVAPGSPEGQQLLDMAARNSERLGGLVDDLLDAQRLEVGDLDLDLREFDLAEAVARVVDLNREYASRFGVQFQTTVVEATAWADPRRFEQMLSNLLTNAAKHSPKGAAVAVWSGELDGGVAVRVTDHGPGIEPHLQELIFDRFEQGTGAARVANGTGLGLWFARTLARHCEGDIAVSSRPGVGATFELRLPRAAGVTAASS